MENGISVIIPVYNAEKFLCQCINSIVDQDYKNIQIILVDDGSTDGSDKICDDYALKYSNITVIHQDNAGVSAARNRGIEVATKEYICFVDADDYLSVDALVIQSNEIYDVDLIITGIQRVNEAGMPIECEKENFDDLLSAEEMLYYLFEEKKYGYQGWTCNKLFRNKIIQENDIRFNQSIKYNEDRLFILEYVLKCKNVRIISNITYFYRKHENSALGKIDSEFRVSMLTELDAFEDMKILVKDNSLRLFQTISRVAFEKSLYWLRRIPSEYSKERERVRRYLRENTKICMTISGNSLSRKIKLMVHCILER